MMYIYLFDIFMYVITFDVYKTIKLTIYKSTVLQYMVEHANLDMSHIVEN